MLNNKLIYTYCIMATRKNTKPKKALRRTRKSRRTGKRKLTHKKKNKKTHKGGSRSPTPINVRTNTPINIDDEATQASLGMAVIIRDLITNRYQRGWHWNVGTGGWMHLGNEHAHISDIIRDVINGNHEAVPETIYTLIEQSGSRLTSEEIVNTKLPSGATPLMLAVFLVNEPMVRTLLAHGADKNDTINILPNDEYGDQLSTSVTDLAILISSDEIVDILQHDYIENTLE
jgi:hypothetical protein